MADWIKLYFDVNRTTNYRAFEDSIREGKRGRRARRSAEDTALAQVVRLKMMLGETEDGRVDMRSTGDRLLAEDCMREEGDDLLAIFDRMASHGVIDRELWASLNVVTNADAVEQAAARQRSKEKSKKANEAKRRKAADGTG